MALQESCTGCSARSASLGEWPFSKPEGVGDTQDPFLAPFPKAKAAPLLRAKAAPFQKTRSGISAQLLLELIGRDRQDPRDALHKNLTERAGNIVV